MKSNLRSVLLGVGLTILFFFVGGKAHSVIEVSVPDTTGEHGDTIDIPIMVSEIVETDSVYSFEMTLTFDSLVLAVDSAYTEGTIAQGWGSLFYNNSIPGQMCIAMAGAQAIPLTGSGVLVYAVFIVNGFQGDTTTIHFDEMMLNEGCPTAITNDGLFTVGPAVCEVSPTSLDFDTVCVGQYSDTIFTITNTGGGTLSGTVSESCDDFSIVGSTSYSLDPGESDTFTVRFEPQSSGPKNCTIETGNDLCSEVSCSGEGDEPECEVSPTSLDFDTVCVGDSSDLTFSITNTGGCTLSGTVSESCDDFSIVGSTSYNLGAGESDTFTVRFEPQSSGPKNCTVETGNNACEDVSCTGWGQDFDISADPDTQQVTQGQETDYQVKLTSLYGFDQPCTLLVSGLPDQPDSGLFDPPTLVPTDSTILTVYTTTETYSGWYTLTITARSMTGAKPSGLEHSIQVVLKVNEASDVEDWTDNPNTPKSFALFQNQPNPFNPETKISYYLPRACQVELTVYNILGHIVRVLIDENQSAGYRVVHWNGKDEKGNAVASGIYFYQIQAGDFVQSKKMVLMK